MSNLIGTNWLNNVICRKFGVQWDTKMIRNNNELLNYYFRKKNHVRKLLFSIIMVTNGVQITWSTRIVVSLGKLKWPMILNQKLPFMVYLRWKEAIYYFLFFFHWIRRWLLNLKSVNVVDISLKQITSSKWFVISIESDGKRKWLYCFCQIRMRPNAPFCSKKSLQQPDLPKVWRLRENWDISERQSFFLSHQISDTHTRFFMEKAYVCTEIFWAKPKFKKKGWN